MAAKPCLCGCGPWPLGYRNMEIYTRGPLLDLVQRSGLYPDCKTFVDMKMNYPADTILDNFRRFCACKRTNGYSPNLQLFVEYHFDTRGTDILRWTPTDWKSEPPFVDKISDLELKQFGYKLNELWKELGRKVSEEVHQNPDMSSVIYLPHPYIAPGGRFVEYYYWDSYWIIIGLLLSGMHETARGMIDNFLALIRQYGFIPNGGRIYYYGRSHPPLLVTMMKAYMDSTNDENYAIQSLPLLESEFNTFLEYHKVEVQGYTMYQYRDTSIGPRPEAYREDLASANDFPTDSEKEAHFTELKAACESGMNFSSRWFVNTYGTMLGSLTDMKTRSIVPVDLNAILFRNCKTLAYLHKKAGNAAKSAHYQEIAYRLVKAIRDVLWNEESGIWFDFDLVNERPRPYFSISNFYPLWTRAFPIVDREKISDSVMAYIKSNNLDSYPGGVPVTLIKTTLQWDFPNVWPCMMYVLIEGLENLGTPEAKDIAERWAHRWVKSNYAAYQKTGYMFEKYDGEQFGTPGVGAEYGTQTGFGWTNAVAIHFLAKYGNKISLGDNSDGSEPQDQPKTISEYIITSEDNIDNLVPIHKEDTGNHTDNTGTNPNSNSAGGNQNNNIESNHNDNTDCNLNKNNTDDNLNDDANASESHNTTTNNAESNLNNNSTNNPENPMQDHDAKNSENQNSKTVCGGRCTICGFIQDPVDNTETTYDKHDNHDTHDTQDACVCTGSLYGMDAPDEDNTNSCDVGCQICGHLKK